jgi:hypothetical protein
MASWDDVHDLATALPGAVEEVRRGNQMWSVRGRLFVWERPLRASDVAALTTLGEPIPEGAILGARVADEGVKQALIADDPAVFFTIPHFDGYNAILIRLDEIDVEELREVITEAWLDRAPPRLRAELTDR